MARNRKNRRGVVLLVVLTLLTLLVVIGVTFALVSGQYRRAAEEAARSDLYEDPPQQLAERVITQVLRDTNEKSSSLWGHSLLRDLYGNDGVRGVVDARYGINPQLNGELIEFAVVADQQQPFDRTISREFQAYTGCVLTMLDGPAAGLSTRVVSYSFSPGGDGAWGVSGADDDSSGVADDISERVWPQVPTFGLPATYVNDDLVIIRVEAFETDLSVTALPNAGNAFLINGRPFNGTGAGYQPDPGVKNLEAVAYDPGPDGEWGVAGVDDDGNGVLNDWTEAGWAASDDVAHPTALQPHFAKYSIPTRIAINIGGSDESYDAPDYQNMLLAMVPPAATASSDIIPSLHRPELVNYWMSDNSWDSTLSPLSYRDFRRKIVFRPMPWDHPNFSGGNPAFTPIWTTGGDGVWGSPGDDDGNGVVDDYLERGWPGSDDVLTNEAALVTNLVGGPWDIDNDGDGIPDSIWVDVGLPIRTSPDGKCYRPLVAILCKDLDGRINLNAHGQLVHMDPNSFGPPVPSVYTQFNAGTGAYELLPLTGIFSGTNSAFLPRGLGVGPAEVHLGAIFNGSPLIGAEGNLLIQARNGADMYLPGRFNGIDDPLSGIKNPGLPNDYYTPQFSSYGMQPDTRGLGGLAIDPLGQPVPVLMGPNNETIDDPYEILQAHNQYGDEGPEDIPFSPAELERLLRFSDIDAQGLPSRLTGLAPNTFADHRRREMVTTSSSHIPSPSGFLPQLFRFSGAGPDNWIGNWVPGRDGGWGVYNVDDDNNGTIDDVSEHGWPGSDDVIDAPNLVTLYHAKLLASGVPENMVPTELNKLIPFELAHGERLNLNRLLGNGVDDNGNQVVDEFLEAVAGEAAWTAPNVPVPFRSVPFNHRNNDVIAVNDSRQILARHLYCLMMMLVDQRYLYPVTEAGLTIAQRRELTAQRLAQWAINVVDFRDADAIMTPFEYDMDPFNGWCADGDLRDLPSFGPDGAWGRAGVDDDGNGRIDDVSERGWGGSDDVNDRIHPERRVVWGCEYPELLLTETLAFHDRRVKDTDLDVDGTTRSDTPTPDDDLDQYRIPQGSLYVEMYATRNRNENNPVAPRELYNYDASGEVYLDLARMAPASNPSVGIRRMPVWQIGISQSHHPAAPYPASGPVQSPLLRRVSLPNSTTFAPDRLSMIPAPPNPPNTADVLDLERLIWFTTIDPSTLNLPLTVSQRIYWNRSGVARALVKPCTYAVVGPRLVTHVGSRVPVVPAVPPDYLPGNQRIELTATGVGVFQVDNTDRTPVTYPNANALILPAQTMVCAANPPTDASLPLPWTNVATTAPQGIGISVTEPVPLDHYYREPTASLSTANGFPFDSYYDYDTGTIGPLPDEPFDSQSNRPLREDNILETETTLDYKTAFLQRLADPTLPWNPDPYLSDGLTPNPEHDPNYPVNTYITVDWMTIDVTVFNGEDKQPASWAGPGDWDPDDPSPEVPEFETRERAGANLNLWSLDSQPPTTSALLNTAAPDTPYFDFNLIQSLGYLNQPYGPAPPTTHPVGATLIGTVGLPNSAPAPEFIGAPLIPFPWLTWNNRPYATALELLTVPASTPARLLHEFSLQQVGDVYDPTNFYMPYSHLLNFFNTHVATDQASHLYAIFDFVDVPAPYVGSEKWLNPLATAAGGVESDTYRPPFNRLSRFRDPGRININTIFDIGILEGIMKGFRDWDPRNDPTKAQQILLSRQGYPGALYGLDPAYPTRFANPFRAAGDASLNPIAAQRQLGVNATLLRRQSAGTPLLDYTSVNPYNNTGRNPFFRYQGLQRLGNMLTTNSNVYAVWLTIGFFEVEPTGVNVAYPDGYRLGQEMGTDSGTATRHRAFYILDRSIPVAFEPGENRNVDRAVLVRRFIE